MRPIHDSRERAADVEFDQYVSYEDDDGLVICDRRNASAWIRCDSSVLRSCLP